MFSFKADIAIIVDSYTGRFFQNFQGSCACIGWRGFYIHYGAVKFLLGEEAEKYGAVITFEQGAMKPKCFDDMIDKKTMRMRTRYVNIHGESFEVARRYMIRLQQRDFDNPEMVGNLARVIHWSPQQFRDEFGYLI